MGRRRVNKRLNDRGQGAGRQGPQDLGMHRQEVLSDLGVTRSLVLGLKGKLVPKWLHRGALNKGER